MRTIVRLLAAQQPVTRCGRRHDGDVNVRPRVASRVHDAAQRAVRLAGVVQAVAQVQVEMQGFKFAHAGAVHPAQQWVEEEADHDGEARPAAAPHVALR